MDIGNYNALPHSRLGGELSDFNYVVGDMVTLSGDNYTWVSDAEGHTKWLDRVACAARNDVYVRRVAIDSDPRALGVTTAPLVILAVPLVTIGITSDTV